MLKRPASYRRVRRYILSLAATNLEGLDLRGYGLRALPAEIGRLTSLRNLDLRDNQLSALPAEIGRLTSLQNLSLGGNQLDTLPAEIGGLTSLQNLSLGGKQRVTPQLLSSGDRGAAMAQAMFPVGPYYQTNRLSALPAAIGRLTS